jgi:hypothetical protein
MAGPREHAAFQELVTREQELMILLEHRLELHKPMLAQMRAVAHSPR